MTNVKKVTNFYWKGVVIFHSHMVKAVNFHVPSNKIFQLKKKKIYIYNKRYIHMCAENWTISTWGERKKQRQKMTFYWSYLGREKVESGTSIKPVLFLHSRGHSPLTQSSVIVPEK